ncbi:MAG: hypothetical protein RR300_02745 [Raoultibacter sp.]
MNKLIAISAGLIAGAGVAAACTIGIPQLTETASITLQATANDIKMNAVNLVIESGDLKSKVESALDENSSAIAAATGLSAPEVDAAIANLDIGQWKATILPEDVVATKTIDNSYAGIEASITTYDNPSYITVNSFGQTITLQIPESAQPLIGNLQHTQQPQQ